MIKSRAMVLYSNYTLESAAAAAKSLQSCPTLCDPIDGSPPGSSMGFSRQEYWSFSFTISPSNEYSGLISFRIDWFDLLVVQGILKSLLQQHSSKSTFGKQQTLMVLIHRE